jgi:hypothetical protein
MTTTAQLLSLAFLFACNMLFLLYVCWRYWKELQPCGMRFHFSIADFWGAVLALVPSMLLLANTINDEQATLSAYIYALIFAFSQFAAITIARIYYLLDCRKSSQPEDPFASAISVLLGGLLVAPMLVACFAVAFLLLPASIVYVVCYGSHPPLSPQTCPQ